MIIDSHVHLCTATPERDYFPWPQARCVAMRWAYRGMPPYDRDPKQLEEKHQLRFADPTGEYTVSSMDYAGVDASVILPVDYDLAFGKESAISIDEKHLQLGELQEKYPGRLYAFAGPDPRRTDALELFKRAIKDYKLKGLKLIPGAGYYPWDERLHAYYDFCIDNGIPVFTCTQSGSGGYRYARFSEPVQVGDMLAEFPDLTVVMLHAGYPLQHWFDEALNVAGGNINAYIEIDFWLYGMGYTARDPGQAWVPNIINDEETIVRMMAKAKSVIGAHKILFGSDSFQGPAFNGPQSVWHFGWQNLVDWWKRLPETAAKYGYKFTSEEVDLILGGNVARILGINRPPEWEVKHKYGWRRRYPSPSHAR